MCRSKVWKGIKVLQPNSITLGIRKLWRIFPIKQKFNTRTAFFYSKNFWNQTNLGIVSFTMVQPTCNLLAHWTHWPKIFKLDKIEHFGLSKKAALVSNFCLIGKICHNFLLPRVIELGCKTFMPFQTLDLHRVRRHISKWVRTGFIIFIRLKD